MPESLTQEQIDKLLYQLTSETPDEEEQPVKDSGTNIKTYNFATADKFPKDQIKTLDSVYTTFSQVLSNRITGMLRTACECNIEDIEQISFNELNNSLPNPVILAVMSAPPMEGQQLVIVSPEAAYMIVSRLLGGTSGIKGIDSSKPFTDIEQALIEHVLNQIMSVFDEAWSKIIPLKAKLEKIEISSQFAQIVAQNEPMVIITLNMIMNEESGIISIAIPHSSIEPISKQLSTKLLYSGLSKVLPDGKNNEQITKKISNTSVVISAYFSDTPATLNDVLSLQVGGVIRLNHKISDPLIVKVQHVPKYIAEIGKADSRYAVKLMGIIKEENLDEPFAGGN